MTEAPMELLVDSHHGIYCYKHLSQNYHLFYDNGEPYTPEDIEALQGDDWCEAVDYICRARGCRHWTPIGINIKADDGSLWRAQSIDGDIFAINPLAVWSAEEDTYVIE